MRCALLVCLAAALTPAADGPVPVIFDTDMGNDIDDALGLAMLHALESRGECRLAAVTLTIGDPAAAPFVRLVNRFYGRPDIPVGLARADRKDPPKRRFTQATLDAWGEPAQGDFPLAAALIGKLLRQAAEPMVVVQVGFSSNLAALLETEDGRRLAREKVRLLSVMAGDFAGGKPEFNVREDLPAARSLFAAWPGEIVVSGFEIGRALPYPALSIERDFRYAPRHPIVLAYKAYLQFPYDRPAWDVTSVLEAVRPQHGYFDLSEPGTVRVDSEGRTGFERHPAGRHRFLRLRPEQRARALEAMTLLASQPPGPRP